jgi:CRISPR-associated protein (TIGR02710 family)
MESRSIFLICTVGGTPEPVVAALKHWRPLRIYFVPTPQTRGDIETKIVSKAREDGIELDAGRYDVLELPDGQDLASCISRLRQLTPVVEDWAARGKTFQVVVDFTGGTKCMSAAVSLLASRWPCLFSYVGGGERTKGGVGVVVSGAEKIIYQANPWDALGHQAVDDFVVLFDEHAFAPAARVAERAKTRVDRPDRKRELAVLEQLAKAFDAWDRFQHKAASAAFDTVLKSGNDLRAVLGSKTADRVLEFIEGVTPNLAELRTATHPSRYHVIDLLANAKRRKDEGRIDDAVARLYRAIEALAQVALRERHGFETTEKVPLARLPETLRLQWDPRAKDGVVPIGLQDAYALLAALKDPLAEGFTSAGLDSQKSPLSERNHSILAHGFKPVSGSVFDNLCGAALRLMGIDEASLPSFPILGDKSED